MERGAQNQSERAWTEVDLSALRHNFSQIRSLLGEDTKILAVLKANAYGHGALSAAQELVAEGLDAVGVANAQEGIELRQAGIRIPIVVLGGLLDEEIGHAIAHEIAFCISSEEELALASNLAKRQDRIAKIHLMVDTGMGRLGVSPEIAIATLQKANSLPNLKIEGIATHFSSPGEIDEAFSRQQIARFTLVQLGAESAGFKDLTAHAASHTALLRYSGAHFNMVRPGLALFGLQLAGESCGLKLKRVLSLHAKVLHVKEIAANTPVSYSRLWQSDKVTKIATVAIGYNDGFRVGLTGKSEILLDGKRCPVVGRVTMDYIMVDIGAGSEVKRGDVATIIGKQGDEEIRVEEFSSALNTVPYEFFCGIGPRVARRVLGASVLDISESLRLVA